MANLQQSNVTDQVIVKNNLTMNGGSINVSNTPFTANNITANETTINDKIVQSNYSVPIILATGTTGNLGSRAAGFNIASVNLNLTRPMTVICEACLSIRPNTNPNVWIYLRFFLDGTVLKSVNMPRTDNAGHVRTLNFSCSRDNVPAGTRNFAVQIYALGASPINVNGDNDSLTYIVKGVF